MRIVNLGARRGVITRFTLSLIALMAVLWTAPGIALAHAHVVSSSPADGSTVSPGITEVSITFDEEISVDQSSAELVGPEGAAMPGVTAAVDRADRTKMTIQTSPLSEGSYEVRWKAVTEDDNGITNGTIRFTVAAGGAGPGQTTGPGAGGEQPSPGETGGRGGMSGDLPHAGAGDTQPLATALAAAALLLLAGGFTLRRVMPD